MEKDLGEFKKLKLTSVWAHEAHEFTPWLAQEENMRKLAGVLGLELEIEGVEVAVGPYSADILAKDTYSGKFVVIENQFGKTNHDHLGKVLTYGATLNASAVVWLAEEFTEEHRKTMEWLNDFTTEDLSLYAVEIELLQIGDSKPAVRFNVVSRPNELVRLATAAKSKGELSDAQKLQLEFWTKFREHLLAQKILTTTQTPRPQYWFDVPLGKSNIFISCTANTWDNRIGVRVYLGNKIAAAALAQLEPFRNAIELEIGDALEWNPFPEKRDKIIALSRDVNLSDRSKWPEYLNWLAEKTARFRKAFAHRIKSMDFKTQPAEDAEHK